MQFFNKQTSSIKNKNFAIETVSISQVEEMDIESSSKKEMEILTNTAESFEITNDNEYRQALEMIFQARKIAKAIDNNRKKLVRPYIDAKKEIDNMAKGYSVPCKEIEDALLLKRRDYDNSRSEIEDKTNTVLDIMHVAPVEKCAEGTVQRKSVWSFELENIEKVPSKFLQLNESEIRSSVEIGVRQIPGIRIFKEIKEIYRTSRS